jgi:hypothetical protein
MLPEPIFIRVFDADSDGSLEHTITTVTAVAVSP